jgi:flagellar basal-body rod modification protein FlgD
MVIQSIHSTPSAATGNTGTNGTTGTTGSTGTGTTGSTGTTSSSSSTAGVGTLGGTDFLTLMLAQLKNQDPTSPVDSNTFLSQLAELSQVQGIANLNTAFSTLSTSLTSNAAMQASSLLGHTATVASSTATTSAAGATVSGAVSVPQTSSDVVLNITNSAGATVSQIDLGAQAAGMANFTWNGTTNTGAQAPAGTYTLTALYSGQTSGSTAATTYVTGTVESVSMGGSGSSTSGSSSNSSSGSGSSSTSGSSASTGLTLNVSGVGSVPFSSVQQISN